MAKNDNKLTVETITHEGATRKNIPTAEYQSMMAKEEQAPYRVTLKHGMAGLDDEKAGRNRDLDPQLVWRGKDEQDWSIISVPTTRRPSCSTESSSTRQGTGERDPN